MLTRMVVKSIEYRDGALARECIVRPSCPPTCIPSDAPFDQIYFSVPQLPSVRPECSGFDRGKGRTNTPPHPRTTYNTPAHGASPPTDNGVSPQLFIPDEKIGPLPGFGLGKYTVWRRGFIPWGEIHFLISESKLLSLVGIPGGHVLREHVMEIFPGPVNTAEIMTISRLLPVIDSNYALSSKEREFREIEELFPTT